MPTTVEVLATAFKDAGTPFIVGHPGGESVELMEAARQRQMRFLLMKQEVAGAMLASTWGDITGSPGICMSTRGPGRDQHGQRRRPRLSRPLAADRHYRCLFAADLRDRPAPAAQPARDLRADRQMEHHDRRQGRAPAGPPRDAHRDRRRRPARCISRCRRARRRGRPATMWPSRRSSRTS